MRRPQDLEQRLVLGFHHLALLVIFPSLQHYPSDCLEKKAFSQIVITHQTQFWRLRRKPSLSALAGVLAGLSTHDKNARAKKDREPDQRFIIGRMNRDGWVERQTKSAVYPIFAPTNNVQHLQCSVRK